RRFRSRAGPPPGPRAPGGQGPRRLEAHHSGGGGRSLGTGRAPPGRAPRVLGASSRSVARAGTSRPSMILYLLFFLSGLAALLFETLWFRLASVVFGNTVWASSVVLAGFMAGLAVGSSAAARGGPRLRRPVRVYAQLELAVALSGLLLVLTLPHL